jgi:hypothetical protein
LNFNFSIQIGGRKRDLGQSKLARKVNVRPKKQKGSSDKKRRISLFRRISTKIANAEIQQVKFETFSYHIPVNNLLLFTFHSQFLDDIKRRFITDNTKQKFPVFFKRRSPWSTPESVTSRHFSSASSFVAGLFLTIIVALILCTEHTNFKFKHIGAHLSPTTVVVAWLEA